MKLIEEYKKNCTARIKRIELTPVFVPFREFVKQTMKSSAGGLGMAIPAEEAWLGGDFVICKLAADDGSFGLGEAFVWLPETGVMPEQIIMSIQRALAKYVIGENPFDVERVLVRMEHNVARNEVAKGLLDMACYDLMGRISDKPVVDLLGGSEVDRAPLAALVPLMDPEAMALFAQSFYKSGFKTVRVKLGRSIGEDVRIMEKVRAAVGNDARLRVDYNQAYSREDAVEAINAIEQFRIDVAEQPVAAADFLGMRYVQKRVRVPLMAHESCFSLQDVHALVELDAVRVVGVNSERPGGVTNALRAIEFAKQKGLSALLHNQPLGISSAMQVHVAAARHSSLGHATELFGHVMLEDDLIVKEIDYNGGSAAIPHGPGWGVELDEDALKNYATGPTVKIE